MLLFARYMSGATVDASDGKVGKLIDFLFDDRKWGVTHLVLDGGTWLNRRRVTLPPDILELKDWSDHHLKVSGLTRQQVIESPGSETHVPISKHAKLEEATIIDWEIYWTNINASEHPWQISWDPHVRNVDEVTGYHIKATDGSIGHIADFVIDDETWTVRYLAVDTRNWWPGKHVLITPERVSSIDGDNRMVLLSLSRADIEHSRVYDASAFMLEPQETTSGFTNTPTDVY
jgi:hypothetical protein